MAENSSQDTKACPLLRGNDPRRRERMPVLHGVYRRDIDIDECSDARFTHTRDGTVTDNQTGLMCAVKDNARVLTWDDAKKYSENYRGGRYADWRLPTIAELQSLYDALHSRNSESGYLVQLTPLIDLTCATEE